MRTFILILLINSCLTNANKQQISVEARLAKLEMMLETQQKQNNDTQRSLIALKSDLKKLGEKQNEFSEALKSINYRIPSKKRL